jgi:CheY-like chemotaxis protein
VEQVLMNLAVNARDAMPDGGRILLQTARVSLGELEAGELELSPGPYVVLNFGDTGVGMSEDVQKRVFEPFFTTKETGKGTGLGMSTAYGIIKQSGGAITVASEEGQGTTFSIYLPQGDEVDDRSQADVSAVGDLGGTETILLVEDDDDVRGLTGRLLRTYGYTVVDAPGAESAVAICEDDTTAIDLVLTDIVMPGAMNGVQLAQWAREHLPDAKVVLMSGHAVEAIKRAGLDDLQFPLVEKPFSGDSLLQILRATLGDD